MDAAVFRKRSSTSTVAECRRNQAGPLVQWMQPSNPTHIARSVSTPDNDESGRFSVRRGMWRSIFLSSGSSSILNLILLPLCLSLHRFGCLPASGLRIHANNNFVLYTFATCDFATAAIFSSLHIRSTPHFLSRAPLSCPCVGRILVCDLLQHSFDRRTRPLDRVVSDRGCLVFLRCLFNRSLRLSESRKQRKVDHRSLEVQ